MHLRTDKSIVYTVGLIKIVLNLNQLGFLDGIMIVIDY